MLRYPSWWSIWVSACLIGLFVAGVASAQNFEYRENGMMRGSSQQNYSGNGGTYRNSSGMNVGSYSASPSGYTYSDNSGNRLGSSTSDYYGNLNHYDSDGWKTGTTKFDYYGNATTTGSSGGKTSMAVFETIAAAAAAYGASRMGLF